MKRFAICAFAVVSFAGFATVTEATLLVNGAFDTFSFTSGSAGPPPVANTTSAVGWSLAVNSPDGQSLAAQFQSGFANADNTGAGGTQMPGTGSGLWLRPFEGNQGGSGEPLAQAILTQSVFAPASGMYQLDFVAGIEGIPNFTAREFSVTLSSDGTGGSSTIDLLANAGSITDGNIGGAASNNKGGTPFSILLTGVTGGDLLTVTAVMVDGEDFGTNPQSGFLDSFVLTRVPEPSTVVLATLMAGVGVVAARRRRRA